MDRSDSRPQNTCLIAPIQPQLKKPHQLGSASMSPWEALGQFSNVAQLTGVDAFGLVSMIVQAAITARRHRDACRQLAQHAELVADLLRELQVAELMRRPATRRPLEQLRDALSRCYVLVRSCGQDRGYFHRLLMGAWMADELRSAQHEIDMYIRLVPLIALVYGNRVTEATDEEAPCVIISNESSLQGRFFTRVLEFTKIQVQETTKPYQIGEHPSGRMDMQEQALVSMEELTRLCTRTEESCPGFTKFDFSQLMYATDNFSDKWKVGRGGFATVYKGQLPDGLTVAMKRLDERATGEFKSEILLARFEHTNLIRLLGWCIHEGEKILLYEFMHMGGLDSIIFHKTKGSLLSWSKRLHIIKGVAEGLVYLHSHSLLIHRDLKPNNILLDNELNPKITDFGSARMLSSDAAEEYTGTVVGTSGYKAPEYATQGLYSIKTDVFSLGVLVLVIISGRRNTILDQKGDTVGNLVRQAWQMWKDGRLCELVDPLLGDNYEIEEIMRCARVALLCAQEDPLDRPTMSNVVTMLNTNSISLMDPKQPSKLNTGGTTEEVSATSVGQSSRTVDITITTSAPISTTVRIIIAPESSQTIGA